ncbi:MAG: glutamyl-tRNA amidotransferase [Gammaproteobacteria bacterium]|jgi:uncharacterized protein YqeY|nr:glutamyl-tRNA amidotransferase [Gammaproteobacteria bacterium]
MSALKETLSQATKAAMKARDKERVATLRMVNAELKRIEIDERRDLSDDDVFAVLNKMLKQRKDAMAQFRDANREDLAAVEAYEIGVIEAFLPAQMDGDELADFVAALVTKSGAQGMQDMGKVMGLLKSEGQGRVDMGTASALVKTQLANL